MKTRDFGRRSKPPSSAAGKTGEDRYSRVDFLRGVIAATIEAHARCMALERDGLALRIRMLQDQLANLKRLSSARVHRSEELGWVDCWRPDADAR